MFKQWRTTKKLGPINRTGSCRAATRWGSSSLWRHSSLSCLRGFGCRLSGLSHLQKCCLEYLWIHCSHLKQPKSPGNFSKTCSSSNTHWNLCNVPNCKSQNCSTNRSHKPECKQIVYITNQKLFTSQSVENVMSNECCTCPNQLLPRYRNEKTSRCKHFESQWKPTYCKSKSSKGHCQSKVTRKRKELWLAAKETKSDGQMPTGRKPLTGSATMWAGAQLFLNRKGLTSYAWVSHALPWNLLHFSTLICAVILVMSVSKNTTQKWIG